MPDLKLYYRASLEDMDTGEKFLNRTAMACAVRSRIDKWDLIKLQSFCKAKDTVNKTKRGVLGPSETSLCRSAPRL